MANPTKELKINKHGNYLYATLDGVDFTVAGVMFNEKSGLKNNYGASVKLKFIIQSTIIKNVNGMSIPTLRANSIIVSIPTTDDKIPAIVQKYNSMIGQDLFIDYNLTDGHKVSIQDEKEILEIK